MTVFYRLRAWFLAIGLIHLATAAYGAPLERKYLLDDTSLVVSVNVKQTVGSPAYKKHYQEQVEQLVKADVAQMVLKDLGFDPLKDVDRITLVMGLSCFKDEPQMENGQVVGFNSEAGPFFIVNGRFDAAKLDAKVKQLVQGVKVHEVAGGKIYEAGGDVKLFGAAMFAAVVDPNTIVIARFKEQVATALEKAADKKQTKLIDKGMVSLLEKLDADQAIAIAATGQMVGHTRASVSNINGQSVAAIEHVTLKQQSGIDAVLGHLKVGDDVKGEITLTLPSVEKAKEMASTIELSTQQMIGEIKRQIEKPNPVVPAKMLAPSLKFLNAVKVNAKDAQVALTGEATAEAAGELLKSWFLLKTAPPRAPAIEPENDDN